MPKLAKQDLDVLELEPAWQALVGQLQELKKDLILSNAFDLKVDVVDRAVKVGQLKMIDEILGWIERQRQKIK